MINAYSLVFGFPVPIILAVLFSEIGNGFVRKATQTATYLPHFLSEVTITGITIMLVYSGVHSTGVLAALFQNMGWLEEGVSMLSKANYFRPLYIAVGIWKESGYSSIVYFAAIMGISPTLYEAMKVDGANKLQELRYVTFPGMAPTLIIMIIMRIGNGRQLSMKTALITGATGGIGGKTAEVLGQAGYEVIVTGIDEAGRDTVMSNLESKGIKAHFYKCDATSEEQVNETFAKIAEKFDHLDLLVNNVGGLGGRQRVSEMETGFMRKVMALNFDSLFFNTRAALPLLKKGTNPSIINFSTIAVTNGGGIGASIYAASKGAVQSYSRALAKDLAEFGIRVNMVSPGTIDTPFHAATDRKLVESWKDSILMKRLGEPREVADVIEFLASDKASFLTGEVIQINGGQAFI